MKRLDISSKWAVLSAIVLLAAGCATSGARGKDPEALRGRVDALETQVAALNQRVDEMSGDALGGQEEAAIGGQRARVARAVSRKLSVRQTQRALAAAGFYKGTVDGKEGPLTKKALKEFQVAHGLKSDGIVGPATTEALSRYLDEKQD